MYQLSQIYDEIKNDIPDIIQLHRRTKAEGLNPQQVARILKMNITLEHQNMDLESEQARLELSNKNGAEIFQHFTYLKLEDIKIIENNDHVIRKQRIEIERLQKERKSLENTLANAWMKHLDNNNNKNSNIPSTPSEMSYTQIQVRKPESKFELKPKLELEPNLKYQKLLILETWTRLNSIYIITMSRLT